MTKQTYEILCNACKVGPKPIADSDPKRWACPSCGLDDTEEDMMREAKEHAKDVAARHVQDLVRKTAAKVSFLKVTSDAIPERDYRWVTAFKME